MSTFRLPDNSITEDVNEYFNAWDILVQFLEKRLNVRVYAIDPGIQCRDNLQSSNTFTLPAWFVLRLMAAMEGK